MSETVAWRPRAGEIPQQPGVYCFRDVAQRVLYVGKAKNLRARLSNYFAPLASLHERTRRMVLSAASVEWTVVGTEFEALQLEFTWIKEFDPPFNVQFRDDKSYPYLAITLGEDVPRVLVTRNRNLKGARYFGPYTKAWAIRETVDLMLKAFPMRSCSESTYKRAEQTGRPCLLGDIGKCAAPCVGRVTKGEHKSIALDFASFMAGNDSKYVGEVSKKMKAASAEQDYESAAKFRDQLGALTTALSKNTVVLSDDVDADIFGIAHDELAAAVQQFTVRGGRIRGVRSWVVDKELDLELDELVETVVHNAYDELDPPRLVVVPKLPDDAAELETWLTELRLERGVGNGRVVMRVAQRGELAALALTVATNARNSLILYKTRRSGDFVARSQALADIQDALGMEDAPLRMECYDVSHLSGTNIVASMVVFEDGLPRKDQYRRFSIPESTDDTESIYQTLSRRLAHLDDDPAAQVAAALSAVQSDSSGNSSTVGETGNVGEPDTSSSPAARPRFAYRPSLLIVDGGQPQVAAAARALQDAGITGIALCGIAKRLEEIWLPGNDYPVILPRNSDALFLIQRIRDEAHRFAITYQRQRRKRDLGSVLSEIPGLGPARVKELLRHFGSVTQLRAAEPTAIAEVKGVGTVIAQTIFEKLRE
ncbi:excinuclease ABC subunit UvrC [Frigoribacterium sp. CG_9.8]|uniref:excinuclease ABC subunit UvrC n=1 Tax=Frigoribacterium sp. CG_9.8 TaxID=2787733 RepID=UPI0018C9F076|nr:excinuclease ABC subunit UvrC [Frigoribacterium sp. CG_9.8]MBG6108133.1 excinuclease ABC subunit C [Frigoribacterium sp. CG_9.8]